VRILVTGANGFLGSACLREARNRQRNGLPLMVRGAVRKSPTAPLPGVEYGVVGDVDGKTDWQCVLQDVQVIIHTAGLAHRFNERGAKDLKTYRLVNLTGTVRLATHAVSAGVQRLVFVSSVGVNGMTSAPGSAFSESDIPRPHNAYAISKWEAEQELARMAATTGLEVVIVRPPLVYGPGAPGNFGLLARAVRSGWPLPLGAIRNQRSFIGLDNLVDFLLTCATDTRAANQTFLVSDGYDLSTTEFVRAIARAGELTLRLLPVPAWVLSAAAGMVGRTGSVRSLCDDLKVSIDEARRVLGWAAPLTLDEGLRRAMMPSQPQYLAGF
jgi:nucleoside-diphosphate-sugar epimerase